MATCGGRPRSASTTPYFASGYGRQYIWVVPDLDLVVVMTGNPQLPSDQIQSSQVVITDYVIPAAR